MSNFVPNQSTNPSYSNDRVLFNKFKRSLSYTENKKNDNHRIKYQQTLYKKKSSDTLKNIVAKDSTATTLHNTVDRSYTGNWYKYPFIIPVCKQNISTIFNIGSPLNFPKGNNTCSPLTDHFYTINENITFYLTIDADARAEMLKVPNTPNIDLNALTSDLNYNPTIVLVDWSPGWKPNYKPVDLIIQYSNNLYPITQMQGRIKGMSSYRGYNKKMGLRFKLLNSSDKIYGLQTVTDLSLNNMVGDYSKLHEYIVYNKIFNDYGLPAPRANYCRLFINDTTMNITSLSNNTITTASNHYLKNGFKIKFSNDLNTTFYVINSDVINYTFKVSLSLNGPEFDLSKLNTAPTQFYFDHGEYINIELVQNEYRVQELFGTNNTRHIYELDPLNGGYELDYGNNDTSDLTNYLDKTSPHPDFYNRLYSVIDINNYIRHAVIELYCGQSDGFYINNMNVHLHSDKNGIFRIIPWGSDSYFATVDLLFAFNKIPLELWGSETTIKLFVQELLKFHDWMSKSDMSDTIETIFNQKINAFIEEKNTDNDPIRATRSFLTDQKNNILIFLSSRQEAVTKFLQRPYPVNNLTATRNNGKLLIAFDPVTKNLKNENTILGINGDTSEHYTLKIVESTTNTIWTQTIGQQTSRAIIEINLNDINVFDLDSDGNNLHDLSITVTPIADPILFGVAPFISFPNSYEPGFTSVPSIVTGTQITTPLLPPLVRITEAMSSITAGPTTTRKDWFEITNFGASSVSIDGWKMDDGSAQASLSTNINPFGSWNTISPNESVICIETNTPDIDIPAFTGLWMTNNLTKLASYSGPGVGLSNDGDGVTIFDNNGIEITRVTFGKATANSSFYWRYNTNGNITATGISSVGVHGAYSVQLNPVSVGIGSPGIY